MTDTRRPRLLFFNGPWNFLGERMRRSFIEPLDSLLRQDFEVISVEGPRDFAREVEEHRPDLVLFHTGCEAPQEPEVEIRNTDAYREIPRIGYVYRDPFSPSRMIAMNRLRKWGVDAVFTAFRASDSPTEYFRDCIYVPFWIDDAVFRDYGEEKDIPISLTGAGWLNKCIYTWRNDVFRALLPRFPVLHSPSLGNRQNGHGFVGEGYARLLNRSRISGGCGTVNRYFTLKLLEIPAARCCLLAEEIEVLKAMGFRDGVNCVFATGQNVAEKVQALLDEPARLQAITDAGFKLVHERHTQRNRRMFAEWFELWKGRSAGERIVQVHPLEPLQRVGAEAAAPARTFPTENPLIASLWDGYAHLNAGRWDEALAKFNHVIELIPCVAEARLGAALCHLRSGRPAEATEHLRYNLTLMTKHFGYRHPDPIDQAFIAILCMRMKDPKSAVQLLSSYGDVRHPALNAIRWIFAKANAGLANNPVFQVREGDMTTNVETVHILPPRSFAEWVKLFMQYLR